MYRCGLPNNLMDQPCFRGPARSIAPEDCKHLDAFCVRQSRRPTWTGHLRQHGCAGNGANWILNQDRRSLGTQPHSRLISVAHGRIEGWQTVVYM